MSGLIDASRSSQYVSSVLMAAPYARSDVTLDFAGGQLVSRPCVELTLQVMRDFGAEVEWKGDGAIHVTARKGYQGRRYEIEPDASAAVYPFCAAAIGGGRVRVEGLPLDFLPLELGTFRGYNISKNFEWCAYISIT